MITAEQALSLSRAAEVKDLPNVEALLEKIGGIIQESADKGHFFVSIRVDILGDPSEEEIKAIGHALHANGFKIAYHDPCGFYFDCKTLNIPRLEIKWGKPSMRYTMQ